MVQGIFVLRSYWLESGYIFRTNQGSALSVVHGVMFVDREIADTTAIIPARQLNIDAYHCWFWGQLEVMAKESLIQCLPRLGSQEYQQILERGFPALCTPQMVFIFIFVCILENMLNFWR